MTIWLFRRNVPLNDDGFLLPAVLSFMILVSILGAIGLEITLTNFSVVHRNVQSQQAFNIAEAGINYYLWHLSHNPTDYQDGTGAPATPDPILGYGPYVHNYIDSNAVNQGTYTLYLSPQGGGSSIVNVRSVGKVAGTNIIRTVQSQIGTPSFASYAVASDTALWFGQNEASNGPIHSNQGIRMDGSSNSNITSANGTYVPPPELGGDGASHPGVWCNPSVTTPVNCNNRPKTTWVYPVPTIDFNQVTSSLCTMKKVAFANDPSTASLAGQASACSQVPATRTAAYIPQRAASFSISKGYMIQLNPDGTYDLFNVNAETDTNTPYTNALTLQSVATSIPVPSSGVIFVEDNVWIRSNPTFHGRVNIGAGRLASASNNANIVIADNLKYSLKNGSDAIGLVAEDSVIVAPYALPASGNFNYEVDAAVLAEAGNVMYPGTYRSNTNRCTRGWASPNQTYTFYGSISVRQTWTWSWLEGSSQCGDAAYDPAQGYISGIEYNTTNYDYNLAYAPPPSFPLISGGYQILSWREVLTKP
jgi:hypothetical protein